MRTKNSSAELTTSGLLNQLCDLLDDGESSSFVEYQDDPVGFAEKVLGETLTADVTAMMESVRDNQITVAVSANATGKSHGARQRHAGG